MLFRARQFEFVFPRPALIMGVVNVTPDSFSDGGKYFNTNAAVGHALELVEQGADILDIGGESTRPGAKPVSEAEELRRVIPVIERLAAEFNSQWGETPSSPDCKMPPQSQGSRGSRPARKILISIDTMKPAVARAALQTGAAIINDVAANRENDVMWKIAAEFRAGYICMHAQGTPQTMQKNPVYADVVREVGEFFGERLVKLNTCGVDADQVVLDVGIGFGKTLEHNLQLLANLQSFTTMARPLLIGVSRKSFIGKLQGAKLDERLPASLACASLAVAGGVQIIRTHDVLETIRAVRITEAVLARKQN
ncbi:MAG: dihydropteroate synthase [Verrucomicrobiota bacterium]|jgi:dihydropteroate synthase